ncbi:MAG TPA: hypothetical protein DD649_11065 [Providencia sp.]|uniref:hypothetical protein n=1 Tax=Providencia sp. TaxID=589 RepID=UPI000E9DFAF2|nr:hypothetical protein [Providencia sp.]HBO23412.1 hypothetical protein [Providencia sp.]
MIINKSITTPTVNNILSLSKKSDQTKSFLGNLNSVNNSSQETHFSANKQNIDKTFNISGKSEELHLSNQKLQANIIKSLLNEKYPDISLDMIIKTMNLGHGGNLQGQKLQYQPENALISLTLLTHEEIKGSKVLACAAKLIEQVNSGDNDKTLKQVLKSSQKAFEVELFDNVLGKNNIDGLIQRFIDKYVQPAIKEKLMPYLSEKTIEALPIDKLFVGSLQETKKELIIEAKNQLMGHKVDKSVDRLLQLHNIFSVLEQQIEIMGQLSVSINTDSNTENPVATNSVKNAKPEDMVDGGSDPVIAPNDPAPASSKSTVNNYVTNNYFMAKELVAVNNEGIKTSQSENRTVDSHIPESVQKNSIEEDENKPSMPRFKSTLEIPQVNNERVAVSTGKAWENTISSVKELHQSILDSARVPSAEVSHMSSKPVDSKLNFDNSALFPKSTVLTGRFEAVETTDKVTGKTKKIWQTKAPEAKSVTLSGRGALTRNQAEKERYVGGPIASSTEKMGIPNNTNTFGTRFKSVEVVDETTGKMKKSWQPVASETQPVTLTTQGALTRNQAEKDRYANGPIASGTEKMGIPNNANVFANRFKSVDVVDEAAGKAKKSWQLADKKSSKPVTLTEMGALTRNQVEKEMYNDNATHFAKG